MITLFLSLTALADPCGMVPPAWVSGVGGPPIERIGVQQTYTFFRQGVQTIAIRPGFTGTVDEFGMLVPMPAVPEIRKIADNTFDQLANAVDPPQVNVHLYRDMPYDDEGMIVDAVMAEEPSEMSFAVKEKDRVVVHKQEAVGMYEVAVLEAGSNAALERWMKDHKYKYPGAMGDVVQEYVETGWMFVAIKARVGQQRGIEPRPGMREVQPKLPKGATFDGYVQGMGFRFKVDKPVVPMRLSTFNGDDAHNRVFALSDDPVRIEQISAELVRRQLPGRQLLANLTEPLPLRVFGEGTVEDIPSHEHNRITLSRDPEPWVRDARDMIAADLLAAGSGQLSLAFEEREKNLLNIGETLGLRGPEIDVMHDAVIAEERKEALEGSLDELREMSLTVVDGEFPIDTLRSDNLTFAQWLIPTRLNTAVAWTLQKPPIELWVSLPMQGYDGEAPEPGEGKWTPFWR
jgi:hypothetical protein